MSDRVPAGPALEQLREAIAILRELANAGPRDNSFKQWRQVTLTLLQRVWAGDQARAVRFRRIPFSPPSARADAKTVRESYVRGVVEATQYLESLAQELEAMSGGSVRTMKRPPEAPLAKPAEPPVPPRPAARPAPMPPPGPIDPSLWEPAEAAAPEAAEAEHPAAEPPAPASPAAAPRPEAGRGAARPRQRLKDMLGFGDEDSGSEAPPPVPPPSRQPAARKSAPSAPTKPATPVVPAPPRPVAAQKPAASVPAPRPAAPAPPRTEPPAPPLELVPDPPEAWIEEGPEGAELDFDFDFTDLAESEVAPAPMTLREMIDREPAHEEEANEGAARDVRAMAGTLDQLGVPQPRRAMVRAALLDLAQQMETPPVDWPALRQAFGFVLEYPEIARRVIPMLVPYLDEAA